MCSTRATVVGSSASARSSSSRLISPSPARRTRIRQRTSRSSVSPSGSCRPSRHSWSNPGDVAVRMVPRKVESCSSELGAAADRSLANASCSRSREPAGASGSTCDISQGMVCRWESSVSSTGGLATAMSTTSAGSSSRAWWPLRTLFQTAARTSASVTPANSSVSPVIVSASGTKTAHVSSSGSKTSGLPCASRAVSGPEMLSGASSQPSASAMATWNVWARSAGCSGGGVRRTRPAGRSSVTVSGPAVSNQLSTNAERSPAPARSQLANRSCIVALPNRCPAMWSTAPAKNASSPMVALSCLRIVDPLA